MVDGNGAPTVRSVAGGTSDGGRSEPRTAELDELAEGLRLATSITAAEAADRGSRISRIACRVHIDLTEFAADGRFTTTTEVTFSHRGRSRPVWLDLLAESVISVRHNGTDLAPGEVVGPERLLIARPEPVNTVQVISVHRAGSQSAGLSRSVDSSDGSVYAWTQFQPFEARRMLPCFDQPDLRGEYRLGVTAPADWSCVSNMQPLPAGAGIGGSGATTTRDWQFASTPPLPVYLLALCAGPFATVTAEHNGLPLGLYARASLADDLRRSAPELLALTRHGMDVFTEAFGRPYQGDSYDHVFLPDQPGAMENLGCITWGDVALFRTEPTAVQRARRGMVLLHELSHQWFGNLVSPRWWDDLWLSESFADWAGWWALQRFSELGAAAGDGAADFKAVALEADQLPSTHPISRTVPDMAAVEASFDGITYAKGAYLLKQLIDLIGEDDFLTGLRAYFQRYAWSAVSMDELLDELDKAATLDVRRWAAEWLRTGGANTIRAVREQGARADVPGLRQSAPAEWPLLRTHRLEVGRYRWVDGNLEPVAVEPVTLSGAGCELPGLAGIADDEALLVDVQDSAYLLTGTDPESMQVLLAAGHTLREPGSRSSLRRLLVGAVLAGEVPAIEAAATLAAALRTESDGSSFSALADQAILLARRYAPPAERGPAGEPVASACLDLIDAGAVDAAGALVAWSASSRTAWTAASTDRLRAGLAASTLPSPVRWRAVGRLLALGVDDLVEAEAADDPDPDGWLSALTASAAAGTVEAKQHGLDILLDPGKIPAGAVMSFADSLWQPHQDELLVEPAMQFLQRLPHAVAAAGTTRADRVARWGFPLAGVRRQTVDLAAELAADRRLPEVVRVILGDHVFTAGRMLDVAGID